MDTSAQVIINNNWLKTFQMVGLYIIDYKFIHPIFYCSNKDKNNSRLFFEDW